MNITIKIFVIMAIIGGAVLIGMSVYVAACNKPAGPTTPKTPDAKEAEFSVLLESTGQVVLTNKYEQIGEKIGSRVFILRGYWELQGTAYKLRKADIVLDEKIFGKITVTRRVK